MPYALAYMDPFAISTARLCLREWDSDDQPAFDRLARSPEIAEWFDEDQFAAAKAQDTFIQRMRRNQRELGWCLWAAVLRSPISGEPQGPIGYCGFGTESLPDPELAWVLLPSLWGRGYATEAGLAVRDHGFQVLRFDRMVSVIEPRNLASRRVAEKVGLTLEGTVTLHDVEHLVYAMDEATWRRSIR